jgi:hypothetical protein
LRGTRVRFERIADSTNIDVNMNFAPHSNDNTGSTYRKEYPQKGTNRRLASRAGSVRFVIVLAPLRLGTLPPSRPFPLGRQHTIRTSRRCTQRTTWSLSPIYRFHMCIPLFRLCERAGLPAPQAYLVAGGAGGRSAPGSFPMRRHVYLAAKSEKNSDASHEAQRPSHLGVIVSSRHTAPTG